MFKWFWSILSLGAPDLWAASRLVKQSSMLGVNRVNYSMMSGIKIQKENWIFFKKKYCKTNSFMLKCGQPQLVTIEFLEQVETLEKYFFSPWLWLRQIAVLGQFCADVISAFINTQQLDQFFQVKNLCPPADGKKQSQCLNTAFN